MDFNRLIFKFLFYVVLRLRREWFLEELARMNSTDRLPIAEIEKSQLIQLNELLTFAELNIKKYQGRFPREIPSLDFINQLPLLEKSEIRSDPKGFTSRIGTHQRMKISGGSTGAPVAILKNSKGMAKELAATWRGYGWAGIDIGDRQVRFWGVPRNSKERWRSKLIDFVCNRLRITAFGYDEASFEKAFERIVRFNPDYFYGYVSIITEFAKFVVDNNLKSSISIKAVITTSEVLTEVDRKIIEEAFNTKVYDEYGCGEVGTIAHECEAGSMHINSENMIVELIDNNGNPVAAGEPGEIVVTDLTNKSMPLIRYRLKDFATLSPAQCPCGRTLPVISKIHGRQYDSLVNRQGKSFHGEFFLYIAEDAKKKGVTVQGIQFVQQPSLALDIYVVMEGDDLELFKGFAEARLKKEFDQLIPISVHRVKNIEREASGKLRVVKRIVDNPLH